jgi:iron complex outermembrane recepter protein
MRFLNLGAHPWAALFATCTAFTTFGAAAQNNTTPTPEVVVVTGSGAEQRAFDTPFAVGVVDAQSLRSAGPMVNLSEALGRVPGLVVNLRNNYAQDLQISSRGFGARATFGVRGIRLYADGIAAAGPDGQGQVSHFDIAGADRVEVLRGPFSALYGSSSGGVISLVSRAPTQAEFSADVDVGSAGLRQGRVSLALPFEGGFSLRASVSGFEVTGFRPQSQATRWLGNVRAGFDSDTDRVVLVINSLNQPAKDPLGLTRAQLDADPDQTASQATQFDTRKTIWQDQMGLQWSHRFADAGPLQRSTVAAYVGKRSVTQWQSITVAAQTDVRSPGGVIDFDRNYLGLDARLFWRWDALRLVTGLSQDNQREERRGFENFIGTGAAQVLGVTGRQRRDEDNRTRSQDLFAQAEVDVGAGLTASGGLRKGKLTVKASDKYLSNGDDSGALSFAYTLPALALRWQPADNLSIYASVGKGYEAPTLGELAYRPTGGGGLNTNLKAQNSTQFELGVKWRAPELGLTMDAALFKADTRDEIGVLTNAGGRSTFQNVGSTQRDGIEASATWRIAAQWRTQVALTVLNATYQDSFLTCAGVPCASPTVAVPAGNRIAGTLPKTLFAELVWAPGLGANAFEMAIETRGQGRQPVNDVNSDFAGGYGLLALRAMWRADLGPGALELLARMDNAADRRVAGSVIVGDTNQRFFEPAAGRNASLSVRWKQRF